MSAPHTAGSGKYFVPSPSYWPIVGSAALLTLAFGAVGSMNQLSLGLPVLAVGFGILFFIGKNMRIFFSHDISQVVYIWRSLEHISDSMYLREIFGNRFFLKRK